MGIATTAIAIKQTKRRAWPAESKPGYELASGDCA
jgi:hypothetical protein